MGTKLAEVCKEDYRMIHVTISSLEGAMVMVFQHAMCNEDSITLIRDGIETLVLKLSGELLDSISVITQENRRCEFNLKYTSGLTVIGVAS